MALKAFAYNFLVLLMFASFVMDHMVMASDADILTDYELPKNLTSLDANYFTNIAARSLVGDPIPMTYDTTIVGMEQLPALRGQGVSLEVVRLPGGVASPIHFHPRSAELLLLIQGVLNVGFIDSKNKLFNQTLQAGDTFVFPKGLIHYKHNFDPSEMAVGIAAYGSAYPGLVTLPDSLFNSGINDVILAQAFKTDVSSIKKIKKYVGEASHTLED